MKRNAPTYLMLVEGKLYGYNNAELFKAESTAAKADAIFKLSPDKIATNYWPLKAEELEADCAMNRLITKACQYDVKG